jgi:lipoprotein-anchoring transpeptidase ErfK/SrfK
VTLPSAVPMRTSPFAIANLVVIVAIVGSTLAAVGSGRHSDFTSQATQLEQRWTEMSHEGVAPGALAPLETALKTSSYRAPWWSPAWWNDPGTSFLESLQAGTDAVWNQAMSSARTRATAALLGWDLMVEHNAPVLTSATVALSTTWASRVAAAKTPAAIETLSTEIVSETADQETEALAVEGTSITALPSRLRQVLLESDQAGAENIAGSAAFLSSYQRLAAAVAAKPDAAAMATLSAQVGTLDATVTATLKKDECGHDVPSGKAIVINLTLQEALFYQNGCVLEATPITSGRRNERTPDGTFHVFRKDSPVLFTSWAPRSSPYWYPPERANYALEFTVVRAGIFLHDAPWEPTEAFGPGSQNTDNASHGCVHAPTSVMAWAYGWANIGTPVIVVD